MAASVYGYTVRERVARPGMRMRRVCVQVHHQRINGRSGNEWARPVPQMRVRREYA